MFSLFHTKCSRTSMTDKNRKNQIQLHIIIIHAHRHRKLQTHPYSTTQIQPWRRLNFNYEQANYTWTACARLGRRVRVGPAVVVVLDGQRDTRHCRRSALAQVTLVVLALLLDAHKTSTRTFLFSTEHIEWLRVARWPSS